jgi:hypothetical protein
MYYDKKTWTDGIRRLHCEAAGVLAIEIFDSQAIAKISAAAALGDEMAAALIGALLDTKKSITNAPRNRPALCISCPRAIRKISWDIVFGLTLPAVRRPGSAIGFAFCPKCAAGDRASLHSKAQTGLRGLWPDLRPVVISHPDGGRA